MTAITDAGRIYTQFDTAFAHVAAYAVIDPRTGECVAKVAIKRAASGLRTTAFVHWLGVPMVKGVANGGGYDKETASVASAMRGIRAEHLTTGELDDRRMPREFLDACKLDGGKRWPDAVRDAGFRVHQVV